NCVGGGFAGAAASFSDPRRTPLFPSNTHRQTGSRVFRQVPARLELRGDGAAHFGYTACVHQHSQALLASSRGSMTYQHLHIGAEAMEKILRGALALTEAMRVTLAPQSKCVLL